MFLCNSNNLTPVICLRTVKCLNSSIESIYRILTLTTIPGQSGPGINGNKGALHIPQSLASYSLVLYPSHSLVGCSYPSSVSVFNSPSFTNLVSAVWYLKRKFMLSGNKRKTYTVNYDVQDDLLRLTKYLQKGLTYAAGLKSKPETQRG